MDKLIENLQNWLRRNMIEGTERELHGNSMYQRAPGGEVCMSG